MGGSRDLAHSREMRTVQKKAKYGGGGDEKEVSTAEGRTPKASFLCPVEEG